MISVSDDIRAKNLLVDSHCHLDFDSLSGDLEGVLSRAAEAGVGAMLTINTQLEHFQVIADMAAEHDNIYCSVGVHPHHAEEAENVTLERLLDLASHPKCVGIGETGLDYFYEHSPRQVQQDLFRIHIAAARESGLPLIVHTRNAEADTAGIIEEELAKGPFRCLLHCFSSSRWLAEKALAMGLTLSISGIVTFKKSDDLRATVAATPVERLLVETDAPYLAPMPKRGKPNEPSYVAHTAAKVAEVKGMEPTDLARASSENFFRLFSKAVPPPAMAADFTFTDITREGSA